MRHLSPLFVRSALLAFFLLMFSPSLAMVRFVRPTATGSGASWADASSDLQYMILQSLPGDTIWAAQGTYVPKRPAHMLDSISPTDRYNAFVLKNGIVVLGGFAGWETSAAQRDWHLNETILSGDLLGDDGPGFSNTSDNAYHVLISAGADNLTLLHGFTIRGGRARAQMDSILVQGHFVLSGRGAGWYNVGGGPRLEHVTIKENYVANNNGGGWYNASGNPRLLNAAVIGNQALNGGGAYFYDGAPVLYDVCFSGNKALNGAACFNNYAMGALYNCTFSGNHATNPQGGGGWHNSGNAGTVSVRNCIFWGNGLSVVRNGGTIHLQDGIVDNGNVQGTHILSVDPLFLLPIAPLSAPTTDGDYRLSPCSPAIDQADSSGMGALLQLGDLGGDDRIRYVAMDLGAWECQRPPWSIPSDTLTLVGCATDTIVYQDTLYYNEGHYVHGYMTQERCDSVVIVHIQKVQTLIDTIAVGICEGDTFDWAGLIVDTPGFYRLALSNEQGCDSIIDYRVFFHPLVNYSFAVGLCEGDSIVFGGQTLGVPGNYYDTLSSNNGCDSIVHLSLSVYPLAHHSFTISLCEGGSFVFGGQVVSIAGDYYDTLPGANGCDSVVHLSLVVDSLVYHSFAVGLCEGDSIVFGGQTLGVSGNYYDTLSGSNGCDSIVHLSLSVYPLVHHSFTISLCEGGSLVFGGQVLGMAGDYYDTLSSVNGCDSIVYLSLVVDSLIYHSFAIGVCAGDSFVFAGQVVSVAGDYYDTLSSASGCDSILHLSLSVDSLVYHSFAAGICTGDGFVFAGQIINVAGDYYDTLSSVNGCDSIVHLSLVVDSLVYHSFAVGLCTGDSFVFGGQVVSIAGDYYHTLPSANGCDSILHLSLVVDSLVYHSFAVGLCAGDGFVFAGQVLGMAGDYYDTLSSVNGCDSIVHLSLVVDSLVYHSFAVGICTGDSFVFAGQTISVAGDYYDTLSSASGCDSIVHLSLIVDSLIYHSFAIGLCVGDSLMFAGQIISVAGDYYDTLSSVNGCDSIVHLSLMVDSLVYHSFAVGICAGDGFVFAGQIISVAGDYYDTLSSVSGCDSIVHLSLVVDSLVYHSFAVGICMGDSFVFAGQYLDMLGDYYDTLSSASGCDSIVHLSLVVDSLVYYSFAVGLCVGDGFVFAGQVLGMAGDYYDTLSSASGCDSIVHLSLVVDSLVYHSFAVGICTGDSFVFAGQTISVAGDYYDTLSSASGCDSIVHLSLIVDSLIYHSFAIGLCVGDSLMFAGQIISVAGDYYDTLSSVNGCDSIVHLSLLVDSMVYHSFAVGLCEGDGFMFAGQSLGISGDYYDTLSSVNGCDSIVHLSLVVDSLVYHSFAVGICTGDSFVFAGQTISVAGDYCDTLSSASGCDSIVHLSLVVDSLVYHSFAVELCMGDGFVFAGQTISVSGDYYDTLSSASGCDSIVHLSLVVDSLVYYSFAVGLCVGDGFIFAGQTISVAGDYYDTLSSANGCDSIVHLSLTVDSFVHHSFAVGICVGDNFVFGGQILGMAGDYYDTLPSANGCDSIVHLSLSMYPLVHHSFAVGLCAGDGFMFAGQTISVAGDYYDTLPSVNGCDSVVHLHLTLEAEPRVRSFSYVSCGPFEFEGTAYDRSRQWSDTLKSLAGCDSLYREIAIQIGGDLRLDLHYNPLEPYMGEKVYIGLDAIGASRTFEVLHWSPSSLFPDQQSKAQNFTIGESVYVSVLARDEQGCVDSIGALIVPRAWSDAVFLPTAFSPNGDGLNDFFRPQIQMERGYEIRAFKVFDRWGKMAYSGIGNDSGWDGRYPGGEWAETGVYTYYIEILFRGQLAPVARKGMVHLLR